MTEKAADIGPPRPTFARTPSWRRWLLIAVGWVIVGFGLLIGPLPGPGPVILVPLGLALILKNSIWAKRVYVRFRARHDNLGRWTDWALGRSHRQPFRPPLPTLREMAARLWKQRRGG